MDPAPTPYMIRINGHLGASVLAHFTVDHPLRNALRQLGMGRLCKQRDW